MSYDESCLTLAQEFLEDAEIDPFFKGKKEDLAPALAERIQDAIDDFLEEWGPRRDDL